ncbi:MAG: PLP-dependent transferase, partial [Sneathiella sp.]
MTNFTHPETIALHASFRGDPSTGSVAVPIHQTTSFQFPDVETACARFALQELGPIYSRIGNPTTEVLEQRMAAMEGGVASLAVSSGQAATALSIQNIASTGDNIVSSTDLYGGSWNLFANTFKTMGIDVRFVDPTDPENFRRATDERTRAYYAETLPNPKLQVFPISDVAAIAEGIGVPLIMDNTAAPILCRPFDFGAHIVVYSTTKYIGGHGTSIGGMIIDSGQFDWERHADRFPMLNTPDPSYHGAVWTEATKPMGPVAYIIKARVTMLRDLGPCMSPFSAFQFIQGLETLPLRMREHTKNAQAVADFLSQNDKVDTVIHPSQMDGVKKARADQHMAKGFGGLVGFEIKGGRDAGLRFIDALEMVYHVANIGDTRTLALHPATSTHQQLTSKQQLAAGVTPG